jgi:Polysaccharide lyase 14
MNRQATFKLVFNSVGGLVGFALAGYVIYSLMHSDAEPPCSGRYPPAMQFALQNIDGAPLTPIELQAHAGLGEWGVLQNATVVPAGEGATGPALEVKLAGSSEGEPGDTRPRNGVSFRWNLSRMKSANAACLSYSVWLPKGFDFGKGGVLPGLFGGVPGKEGGFTSRLQWRSDVYGELAVAPAGSRYHPIVTHGLMLSPGRWMRIEQEMVLNTPGASDGMLRLWADGQLKADAKNLELCTDETARIMGVLADVGYLRERAKAGVLRLSPFEIAWR